MSNGPKSWAEDVQEYCRARCGPGPPLEPKYTFSRKDGEIKAKERAFNPILQRPIDRDAAKRMVEQESEARVSAINKGMERSLLIESHVGFDLLNHQPKFGISEAEKMGGTANPRGKRIRHAPESSITWQPPPAKQEPPRYVMRAGPPPRQYDMLSHRYYDDHHGRIRMKDEAIRERHRQLTAKGLNPISGTYNDPSKEQETRRAEVEREAEVRSSRHKLTRRTDSVTRRSEGHSYNIIDGEVHNPDTVAVIDRGNRRGVQPRVNARHETAVRVARQIEKDERAAQRALNRISEGRRKDACRSGYDIIKGEKLPALEPDKDTWTLLTRSATAQRS